MLVAGMASPAFAAAAVNHFTLTLMRGRARASRPAP